MTHLLLLRHKRRVHHLDRKTRTLMFEIVNGHQLREVRVSAWSYLACEHREIYKKEAVFTEPDAPPYQVLHEWTILHTPQDEFYGIIAIFGVEYAINLGGPEIDGYVAWLQENEGVSPLEQAVEHK